MNGYKDPRREKMFTTVKMIVYDENFQPQEVDGYAGIRIGIDVTTKDEMVNAYSIPIISSTSPFLWMNAAEITFLRAEGALRGWNMGGEAKDLYNMAIAFLLNNMVCRVLKPMRRIRLTLRKRTMIRHLPILIGKVREVLLLLLGKMVRIILNVILNVSSLKNGLLISL